MQINTKKELRKYVITLLRGQEEEKRQEKSLAIHRKLLNMNEFQQSSHILFYASTEEEVITTGMINDSLDLGKTVGLPYFDPADPHIQPRIIHNLETDTQQGPYGIRQPKIQDNNIMPSIDMVIVPGVAFDMSNRRLGRGGGYYDRFLGTLPAGTITVGLAYDIQVFDQLPQVESHDVPVTHVLSN